MSIVTKNRLRLTQMDAEITNHPVNVNAIEIGPIKVEPDTSTDYESNDESETTAKKIQTDLQEPKNEKMKKRGKNFSAEEELILVELVEERNDVLNNRKSDAFTWRHKEEVWAELTDNFVAKTGIIREWRQLRDKYLHMKRRAKAELAKERAISLRLSGEPTTPIVSTVSEKIVAMIGEAAFCLKKSLETDASIAKTDQIFEGEEEVFDGTTGDQDTNDITVSEDDMTSTSSKWAAAFNTGTVHIPTVETKAPESISHRKRILQYEQVKLLQLQQNFCRCENERAQEKHDMEMLEKRCKVDDEARERKLRLELLEIEIQEKKAKLDIKCMNKIL